jgi:glycosyltransferase involved in cell wall biosynthesis
MSPPLGWWLLLGGIALFWLGVIVRVRRSRREDKWRLGPDAPVDVPLPPLVVLIPARNEAGGIAACIEAVRRSDHPSFDVRVFDDGSTDGTGDLARAAGARVETGADEPLPEGWKGKPWALQRATRSLDGEWILFLDADVRVTPEALARVHAYAVRENLDFLSGFGRLTMEGFWEKVIQPSVGGLILAGNDLDAVNDASKPDKVIANGQLILVRRSAYEAVGGHGAVRDDILDDVGLAKAFVSKGFAARTLMMRDLFSCRMYTNLRELWYGWTKNLYAGIGHRRDRVAFLCGFLFVEFLLPYLVLLGALATRRWDVAAMAGALVALIHGVRYWMDGIFGQDRRFGLFQPLGATMLIGLLIDSSRRSRAGSVLWKGRRYAVKPADAPSKPEEKTTAADVAMLAFPLVATGGFLRWALSCIDRHEQSIQPLGGLAYATFVQLCHNWSDGFGWMQSVHRGYANEWRWGGHYTPLLFVTAWLSSFSSSPWALARVQACAVALGLFGAWKLGKAEAKLAGGLAGLTIYGASGAVALLALADYQDLILLVPITPLLVWAARHARIPVFLACAALYCATREEAILLLPFVALSGGIRRALLSLVVSAAYLGVYSRLPPPQYPNPLHDILAWHVGSLSRPHAGLPPIDWNFYGTMASAGWPWLALAPEVSLAGAPVLLFHLLDPTSVASVSSPAIHHLSPFVGVAIAAGIVGVGRVMRRGRAWAWGALVAVIVASAWQRHNWEWALGKYGVRGVDAVHPAWALLEKVPTNAVLVVPEAIAPAAARRRWVVTPDSIGDRVQADRIEYAVDDGSWEGEVVATNGSWRLLRNPVVPTRSEHPNGPTGRQ